MMNGLPILMDLETHTLWDHITGKAISGDLEDYQLDVWPVRMTTVEAVLEEAPNITISPSPQHSFQMWIAQKLYPHFIHNKVWFPFLFQDSLHKPIDSRLDKLTQGLGVVDGKNAKYYPITNIPAEGIEDKWNTRILKVTINAMDGVPTARWRDCNELPMQLLTRWYGFSYAYPGCIIYCKE